ncbi:MAG TPA: PilZ domain-containing protein [Candidatus Limnocylindrales bacterium]
MAINPKDLSIHDEMVVETEIDGVSVGLPAFITNILAEELWLATRLSDPRLAGLSEGQPVHLSFGAGGGLIVESVFIRRLGNNSKLGMEKSRVFAVRRPQGVDTVQRRAHARVDLERSVRIKALGGLGTEKMGNGKTINIGAGGVQFMTDMPLLYGEQVRIALMLTSRDIVVAGGVIVRIEDGDPIPAAPGAEPGSAKPAKLSKVAVRFDKVSEEDQERITCHILAAHRQLIRPAGLPARVARHGPLVPVADPADPAAQAAAQANPPEKKA